MKKYLLILLLSVYYEISFSQKQTNFWCFGTWAGLNFNGGSPVVLTNDSLNTAEGCSAISDASGNLLFYTDGIKVWNKNNSQMPNGFGLLGDPSSTQSALIIPNPGNANLFYIFTLPAEGGGNFNYSVVDMTLQGGKGDVTTKNSFLKNSVTEKQTAVHHCNGHDIWIAIHELGSNAFYAYLVTNSGINPPVISNVGPVYTDVHGQMKFNTSGTKIACTRDSAVSSSFIGLADMFDFDNTTGIVSKPVRLTTGHEKTYGIEFSSDNSKLYLTYYDVGATSWLSQFDLTATNIQATSIVIGTSSDPNLYSLQLGPDHKIYVTKEVTPFLSVINSPNLAGASCNYADNAINLDPTSSGRMCLLGLPAFIQSYLNPAFPNIPCAPVVHAAFQSSDTVFCKGTCINFTDLSSGSPSSWHWTFTGATPSSSNVRNPSNICYNIPGIHTVKLVVSNGTNSDSTTEQITVNTSAVNAGTDFTITPGASVQLNATGSTAGYTWTPSTGLSNTNIANPIASPSVTTIYIVSGSSNNCSSSDSVTIYVEIDCNGNIFVPTAFSPNGNGHNETECVMGNCVQTMVFAIYDRWGEKVFESSDQKLCWDGNYKGKQMDSGVFVYYLKATLTNGKEISQKGNVSLIR